MRKYCTFLLIILIAILASCGKKLPGGFWLNFRPKDPHTQTASHTATHGIMETHWHLPPDKKILRNELIHFASRNQWILGDSVYVPADSLKGFTNGDKKTFPFAYGDFYKGIRDPNLFQREIESNAWLYRFKTTSSAKLENTETITELNGYALLSADRLHLSVYYYWNE